MGRVKYWRRVLSAYVTASRSSHLTFWHGVPEVNENVTPGELGEYYMPFTQKADYPGPFDAAGVPLLDYHGAVGQQYNPIAIAQYGLGNYNLYRRGGAERRKANFYCAANWLVDSLERNEHGVRVWNHHFDWEYRTPLKAPWYSALSQGQGISVLVRAHLHSGKSHYLDAAHAAFEAFTTSTRKGGVAHVDADGYTWFEEAVVHPPTHILNGFIWAAWGVYDYWLHVGDSTAEHLFQEATRTLIAKLPEFDTGFWSLYEQSGTWLRMIASPFYHRLHVVQLEVMLRLTGESVFSEFAERWAAYQRSSLDRNRALAQKALFKLLYY